MLPSGGMVWWFTTADYGSYHSDYFRKDGSFIIMATFQAIYDDILSPLPANAPRRIRRDAENTAYQAVVTIAKLQSKIPPTRESLSR